MEQQDLLNKKVGNKESQTLKVKDIVVQGIRFDDKSTEAKKVSPLLVVICKHPDKDEPIEMTKIKIVRNEKMKVVGLWANLDEDGNIQKGSAIADLLSVAKVETIKDLEGRMLSTVKQSDESHYLCIKGY